MTVEQRWLELEKRRVVSLAEAARLKNPGAGANAGALSVWEISMTGITGPTEVEIHIVDAFEFARMRRAGNSLFVRHCIELWLRNETMHLYFGDEVDSCSICKRELGPGMPGAFLVSIPHHDPVNQWMTWAICTSCTDRDDLRDACVNFVRGAEWPDLVVVPASVSC